VGSGAEDRGADGQEAKEVRSGGMIPAASRLIIVLLCACPFLQSGCAAFRTGQLEEIRSWPLLPNTDKKSIAVLVNGKVILGDALKEASQAVMKHWTEYTIKAYRESGLFSSVTAVSPGETDSQGADLRAEVDVLEKGRDSEVVSFIWGFISGYTMTIIPANARGDYILETVIKDRNGQTLGSIKKSEGVSFWIQLFLVFLMPTHWPPTVIEQTIVDINRATIIEARSKGYF
jgi:hypothetical protein